MKPTRRGFFGLAGRGALAAAAYMAAAPAMAAPAPAPAPTDDTPLVVGDAGPVRFVSPAVADPPLVVGVYAHGVAVHTHAPMLAGTANHTHSLANHTHAVMDHMHTGPTADLMSLWETLTPGTVALFDTTGPLPPGWRPAPEFADRYNRGAARP